MRERELGPNRFERLVQGSDARRQMIAANLGVLSSRTSDSVTDFEPQEIIKPWRWTRLLPPKARKVAFGVVSLAGAASVAATCAKGAEPEPKEPGDDGVNQPKVEAPIDKPEAKPVNPNGFLDWPYPPHPNMNLVQSWIYKGFKDGQLHRASDFILGTNLDDAATWQKFAVLAAADGLACQESFNNEYGQTYATRVRHPNGYDTRNLHMDPTSISKEIPRCSADKKKGQPIKRGDKLGEASDTGTEPGWYHNHFEVFDPSGKLVDPYDIYGQRDKYPDPNLKNGIPCGEKALWVNCPKGEVLGARTTAPTPTTTLKPAERKLGEPNRVITMAFREHIPDNGVTLTVDRLEIFPSEYRFQVTIENGGICGILKIPSPDIQRPLSVWLFLFNDNDASRYEDFFRKVMSGTKTPNPVFRNVIRTRDEFVADSVAQFSSFFQDSIPAAQTISIVPGSKWTGTFVFGGSPDTVAVVLKIAPFGFGKGMEGPCRDFAWYTFDDKTPFIRIDR